MATFVKGDVVIVPFPFSDLTQAKRRPALVIVGLQGNTCSCVKSLADWLEINMRSRLIVMTLNQVVSSKVVMSDPTAYSLPISRLFYIKPVV